jgi:hypothetical protein
MNGTVTAKIVRGRTLAQEGREHARSNRARAIVVRGAKARGARAAAAVVPGFFDSPNAVLGLVLASTIITSGCGFVVYSNAFDAQRATFDQAVASAAAPQAQPAADNAYPLPAAFDTTVSVTIDAGPQTRTAPALADSGLPDPNVHAQIDGPLYTIVEGRPDVAADPRPVQGPDIVTVARNLTIARLRTLPAPIARPVGTTTPAWPDQETGPQTSALLAAASPRPSLRPEDLVTRVAARPDDLEIEVARGEVGELPSGSLFGGTTGDCSPRLAREMPRRPGGASGGASVMAAVGNGSGSGRDNRLVQEAVSGNMPNYMRDLHPVTFDGNVGGRSITVTICVTPDYLAIGSDDDHVRVPLGLPAALRVADAFDMMLPTTEMVDAIYRQADVRVAPSPMTPGSAMSSTNYFVTHDQTLDAQFARAGAQQGMLVAGHKKDLVIANRLSRNPGRVAIYGWHRTNGRAIQPLSTVHGEYYADYSHGIRLVSRTAFVNGEAVDLRDLLTDERYASFLNSDGALTGATVRLASL